MSVQGLKWLKVWVRAKDFAIRIYTQNFAFITPGRKMESESTTPASSLSIPANIAKGYGRFYYQENVRFCYTARGSLEESLSHLLFAFEANYIPDLLYKQIEAEGEEIDKMLNGYISYLKKSKQGAKEPGATQSLKEDDAYHLTESSDEIRHTQETTL